MRSAGGWKTPARPLSRPCPADLQRLHWAAARLGRAGIRNRWPAPRRLHVRRYSACTALHRVTAPRDPRPSAPALPALDSFMRFRSWHEAQSTNRHPPSPIHHPRTTCRAALSCQARIDIAKHSRMQPSMQPSSRFAQVSHDWPVQPNASVAQTTASRWQRSPSPPARSSPLRGTPRHRRSARLPAPEDGLRWRSTERKVPR